VVVFHVVLCGFLGIPCLLTGIAMGLFFKIKRFSLSFFGKIFLPSGAFREKLSRRVRRGFSSFLRRTLGL
jgi:hypothetical protein